MTGLRYRLHDTEGDDLGVLVHPAPNIEAEDEIHAPRWTECRRHSPG